MADFHPVCPFLKVAFWINLDFVFLCWNWHVSRTRTLHWSWITIIRYFLLQKSIQSTQELGQRETAYAKGNEWCKKVASLHYLMCPDTVASKRTLESNQYHPKLTAFSPVGLQTTDTARQLQLCFVSSCMPDRNHLIVWGCWGCNLFPFQSLPDLTYLSLWTLIKKPLSGERFLVRTGIDHQIVPQIGFLSPLDVKQPEPPGRRRTACQTRTLSRNPTWQELALDTSVNTLQFFHSF